MYHGQECITKIRKMLRIAIACSHTIATWICNGDSVSTVDVCMPLPFAIDVVACVAVAGMQLDSQFHRRTCQRIERKKQIYTYILSIRLCCEFGVLCASMCARFVAVCAMCMCWCFFRSIAFRIHYLCLMARCTTCFTLFIFFSVGLFISLLSVWIIHLICDSNISLHLCLGEKNKERTKMSFANNNAFCTSVDQRKTQARQTGGRHTFRSNLILLILWLRIWFVAVAGLNCS